MWSIEPLPEPIRTEDDATLAAGHGVLALLYEGLPPPAQLHVLRAGSWKVVPIGDISEQRLPMSGDSSVLVMPDRLLLGYAAGEWGGALVSLDLATGAATSSPRFREPVTALVAGPDGAAWAAMGLSHMGRVMGSVSRLDAAGWTVVAEVDGYRIFGEGEHVSARVGWDLPLASFDALAFDDQGRLDVLTRELGVVRRDGAGWTRLTPGWPEDVYCSGLVVRGSLLAIATYGAGVWLWDVSTGRVRLVELEP